MAKVKFEEDDTVAFMSKTKGLRIGLINKIYTDDSSSDEDDLDENDGSSDDDKSLKPDQVRIEWYPTGRESVVGCDNVKLVDRTLLMGEVVRPVDDQKKVGFISNVSVSCDVALLPDAQFVLKNVEDLRIDFIQKYCDSNSEPKYVLYENWVGSVSDVVEKLTLKSARGYRCTVVSSSDSFDLMDASYNRIENSAFDDQQWYAGQTVKCSFNCLRKAVWLLPKLPPEQFTRRIASDSNSNRKAKFIVENVEVESFNIHWISPVVGLDGRVDPPNSLIMGEDIKKLKLINRFEHQFVQIGDRLNVEILPSDTLMPIEQWRRALFDEIMNKNLHVDNNPTKTNTTGLNLPETLNAVSTENMICSTKANVIENESIVPGAAGPAQNDELSEEWSDCESETSEKTDKAISVSSKSRLLSDSYRRSPNNNNVTLKWLRKLKSPFKVTRPPPKKLKSSSYTEQQQQRPSKSYNPPDNKPCVVGQRFSGEAIFVRTYADVIWQDGSKSERIPTSRLSYAEIELDEHMFFPGSFVLLQEDKGKLWPPNGYGVVSRVDVQSRLADVAWYEVTPSIHGSFGLPVLFKTDRVSVYDLVANSDYQYSSGCLVMRIENLKMINEVYVGQVLYTTSEGSLCVQWLSGEFENVYPQELCKLVNDDAAWSDHSDNLSADDDASSVGSDDSWSTVEESDNNDSDDSAEEPETESTGTALLKMLTGRKVALVESIISDMKGLPTKIRDSVMELRKNGDSEVAPRKNAAKNVLRLSGVLKKLHAKHYKKPLNIQPGNDDLKLCITRIKQWLNALSSKSRRREHFYGDSLSDDSTTYLDEQVQKAMKAEGKLNDYVERRNGQDGNHSSGNQGSLSSRHSNKRSRQDAGRLVETFQLFARLLSQLLSRFVGGGGGGGGNGGQQRTSRSSVDDAGRSLDFVHMESLMESLRDNNIVFEHILHSAPIDSNVQSPLLALGVNSANGGSAESTVTDNSPILNDNAFVQRLIDAQRAVEGPGLPGMIELVEFMTSSMSIMLQNKTQLDHVEETPDSPAVVALIDVMIVSALLILQSIIVNFFDAEKINANSVDAPPATGAISEPSTPKASPVVETNDFSSAVVDCSSSSSSSQDYKTANSSEISSEVSVVAPIINSDINGFDILEEPPTSHVYVNEMFDSNSMSPKFIKAVRQELKVLRSSLAPNIFVKTYEKRMDLFSVMIRGAAGTPYVNGLFIFDVRLTSTYPQDPPTVFYRSFSSEQLNPNLYQDGKVCVSLLGTWSGKDSEVWNPGSNLLQVLVSIQGLILNAEPYFNEAGYESRRALPESVEKSRCYNEMALIRSLENLVTIATDPPPPFEKEILDHVRCRGAGLVEEIRSWLDNTATCNFPLQPISLGCSLSAKKQLKKLEQILAQQFD